MRREAKVAIGIGGIVIVAAVVGLVLFLFSGSQLGIGFIVVGIPALLLVGVAAYVRGVVTRSTTSETDYVEKRAREVGDALRACVNELDGVRGRYPEFDPGDLEDDLEQVVADLANQGVSFDREAGVYTLSGASAADLQELERIEGDVEALATARDAAIAAFAHGRVGRLERTRRRLADQGILPADDGFPEPPSLERGATLDDVLAALGDAEDAMDAAVRASISEVSTLLDDVDDDGVDEGRVRDALATAEADCRVGDYEAAVDAVLSAHDGLETGLSDRFEADRTTVSGLAETIQSSVVHEYASRKTLSAVEEVAADLSDLDSALAVAEVETLGARLRGLAVDLVSELESELDDALATLAAADLPADFYDRPAAADGTYPADLDRVEDLEEFRQRWLVAVGELSGALDDLAPKAAVADSYPEVADLIDERLREAGRVTDDDLPVRRSDEFMELYADVHADVSFDPATTSLTTAAAEEEHEVTVLARFGSGGPERELTVSLSGPGHEDERTVRTHLAEEVRFEAVPYGEYEIEVTTPEADYRPAAETVMVDADASVELTLAEVGLLDRLCDGVESDVRAHLPDLADDLASSFEAEGYLSSSMDFPMAAEYVPCLMAVWADEEGQSVSVVDEEVFVHDAGQLSAELSFVVENNLGDDDEMTYDQLRENFLTASLPDAVIREAAADLPVEATDDGIRKE